MASTADSHLEEGAENATTSQNSADQNFVTFIDVPIKEDPDGPGMEIFNETQELSQFTDQPTTSSSSSNNCASDNTSTCNGGSTSSPRPFRKITAKKHVSIIENVLRLALTELRRTSANHLQNEDEEEEEEEENDVCMAFGQMVANELRLMKPVQRIVAKKLINEALYYGSMGSLQTSSAVMVNLMSREFGGG